MVTEERVINLERTLARFIEQTNLAIAEIRSSTAEIRSSNRRTDERLLELQHQADEERRQAAEERRRADEERRRADEEWKQERRDFNKRLAELSDSMGTLIEDMVAPSGFQLAKAVFGTEEAHTCGIRIEQKHPTIRGEMMELDLLAVGPTKLLVVEVKRKMDAGRAAEYKQNLQRLPEFFPELAGKTVCAGVASVYLAPSVITFLNRQKLYGIAMGDEVMEVVNLGRF